ncbi:MAG: hypothetical protein EOO27_02275 [Comamonadaceae bacterium]|nr:MAG: hypothetical protein EOO27_02275 [Comamonadaceae bacterium]
MNLFEPKSNVPIRYGGSANKGARQNATPHAIEDNELREQLIELDGELWDYQLDKLVTFINAHITRKETEARLDTLEGLLNDQDQELDLDGRSASKPYYLIGDERSRDYIETLIDMLRTELNSKATPTT